MGVSVVIPFCPFACENIAQFTREEVVKRVVGLGAVKCSNFTIDYDVYYATCTPVSHAADAESTQRNHIHLFHHSDYPHSSFCILDSGAKSTFENSIDAVLAKMKCFFCPKKSQSGTSNVVEIRGHAYSYVDFIFRVGAIHFGPNPKYFTLEVEYLPCIYQSKCKNLIEEVLSSLLGNEFKLSSNLWSCLSGVSPNSERSKQQLQSQDDEEMFETVDCIERYWKILSRIKQGELTVPQSNTNYNSSSDFNSNAAFT